MRVSIYSKGAVPRDGTRIFLQRDDLGPDERGLEITNWVTSLKVSMAADQRTVVSFDLLVDDLAIEVDDAVVLEQSGKRIDFKKLQEARRARKDP